MGAQQYAAQRQAFPFQCHSQKSANDGRRSGFPLHPRPAVAGTAARATVFRKARTVRNCLDYTGWFAYCGVEGWAVVADACFGAAGCGALSCFIIPAIRFWMMIVRMRSRSLYGQFCSSLIHSDLPAYR
jgi:hypothetical protein